jgi:hypothetical protein
LVFDAGDASAANALIDQVKYEKQINGLATIRFGSRRTGICFDHVRYFPSTVLVIVMGIGTSIVCGLIAGFIYFQLRERRRAAMGIYTDAGGMTRLNLDGFYA